MRNAQLCIFTIPIAFAGTLLTDDPYFKEDGNAMHGFTAAVWAAILTNAVGGMIVAAVMKFAGNILRNFAQAWSPLAAYPTRHRTFRSAFSHTLCKARAARKSRVHPTRILFC